MRSKTLPFHAPRRLTPPPRTPRHAPIVWPCAPGPRHFWRVRLASQTRVSSHPIFSGFAFPTKVGSEGIMRQLWLALSSDDEDAKHVHNICNTCVEIYTYTYVYIYICIFTRESVHICAHALRRAHPAAGLMQVLCLAHLKRLVSCMRLRSFRPSA